MQLSNIPDKLVLPFANAGGKNTIPVNSQIGIVAGAASLIDGFPPLTRTPIDAGGIPPSGLDMNGILYEISDVIRWANAGGGYPFDGTFATDDNVGGYPIGARIMRADGDGYWLNMVENNVTDPEDSGAAAAGWVPDFTAGVAPVTMTSSNVTLTPAQYGKPIISITGALTANLNLIFPPIAGKWSLLNNTTGNYVIVAKTASGSGISIGSIGSIVGDGVNIYSVNVDTTLIVTNVAALRNVTPTSLRTIQTRGYYSDSDGGAGQYLAATGAAPGTYVHNGGTIIVPNGGNGSAAWILNRTSGDISLKQFGAKLDGTDDSAFVQSAINFCAANNWPDLIVPGTCYLATSVNINRPVNSSLSDFIIKGEGYNAGFTTDQAINLLSSSISHTSDPVSERIDFQNLTFAASTTALAARVIDGNKFLRLNFQNCFFRKIKCATTANYLQSYYFGNCSILTINGYFLNATGNAMDVHWVSNLMEDGKTIASATGFINCAAVVGCSFNGGVFQGNEGPFYNATTTYVADFSGIYFELNTDIEIKLGECWAANISGNLFDNPIGAGDKYCVDCTGVHNLNSSGNYSSNKLFYNPPTSLNSTDSGLISNGDYAVNQLISTLSGAAGVRGNFTGTLTGMTTTVTMTVDYEKIGRTVTLSWPEMTGTSNAVTMYLTGIPDALLPHSRVVPIGSPTIDNGTVLGMTGGQITSDGIQFAKTFVGITGLAFTNSGTKGISAFTLTYLI